VIEAKTKLSRTAERRAKPLFLMAGEVVKIMRPGGAVSVPHLF
jgi:hypothetical protein